MIKRKKNIIEPKKSLLIVCATEAEVLFFSQMRKDCGYINLTVVKALKADSLKALVDSAAKSKNAGRFDSTWALFGFNDVNTSAEEVLAYQEYSEKKKVRLCWFNPSFELWIALHFQTPVAFSADIAPLMNAVKAKLPGFAFTPEYLLTEGINLHYDIFGQHSDADSRARLYNAAAKLSTGLEATTMPRLNEDISEICGLGDMSRHRKRK